MSYWKATLGVLLTLGVLSALLMAGPPDKTQRCTATGEIESVPEVVQIGTSVGAWVLVDEDGGAASLWLAGDLVSSEGGHPDLAEGYFHGHARMLKQNGPEGARFDFEFDTVECTSTPADCGPPPWGDDDDCCRFRLVLRDGTYERKQDLVEYTVTTRVDLADYSRPLCSDVLPGEECVEEYLVGTGSVNTSIVFQFLPDSDEGGGDDEPVPEKGDLCGDGIDNDLDGFTDCDDRGCKKECP